MEDEDLTRILLILDNYAAKMENPCIVESESVENVKKLIELCRFVESVANRAMEEGKAEFLESHLRARWAKEQNRTSIYTMSQLKTACDKMLEAFLKDPQIPTPFVEKLLQYYAELCGTERLNSFIGDMLENSMLTQVILECMSELGVSEETMEDEVILRAWENEAARGKQNTVSACIAKMLEDSELEKVVNYALHANNDGAAKKLIMEKLTVVASEYEPKLFVLLADLKTKYLCRLLEDSDFQIYFFDGIFYFGRNMESRDNSWLSSDAFDYQRLIGVLKSLSEFSDDLKQVIADRLMRAKITAGTDIWIDVERDIAR